MHDKNYKPLNFQTSTRQPSSITFSINDSAALAADAASAKPETHLDPASASAITWVLVNLDSRPPLCALDDSFSWLGSLPDIHYYK